MIQEIEAKSILRRHRRIDSWFVSSCGLNLYRGCAHDCVYCDGRDEKYRVDGTFNRDISVKINAIDILKKELDPAKRRKPFGGGFMVICGGVSDAYQPCEKSYLLCRRTLELMLQYRHPVHILTKSTMVERDLDLLQEINRQNNAVVSFSFSSTDDPVGRQLEPGVPPPSERLKTIARIKRTGIACGMYLMPVVPYITDTRAMLDKSLHDAADAGVDFVIFGGMTLKPGVQKDYFTTFLERNHPELVLEYEKIYSAADPWGAPDSRYFSDVEKIFCELCDKYRLPKRMPSTLFESVVSKKELVVLILEQLDYLVKLRGKKSPYGYASSQIWNDAKPVEFYTYDNLLQMPGIGTVTANIITEIITTGRSGYYEKML